MLFQKPSAEWLIVGLGNPGPEYAKTRHNAGFRAVDLLARDLGAKIDRAKCKGLLRQTTFAGKKAVLVKPQTFMNESGACVRWAADYFKIPPERILVLFDDISLPVGKIRVRPDGSAGGHNGIKSLIQHLGTQDFPRIKIGVGAKPHPDYDLASWVLSEFTKQEEQDLAPALRHAVDAAEELLRNGVTSAANRFNGL